MGPGIPGIGIAGLFYVVAAILAPCRELYLTVRGRSSRNRWAVVMRQFALAWAIVAAVVAFYLGLEHAARNSWLGEWGPGQWHLFGVPNVVVAVVLLTVVLGFTGIYAAIVRVSTHEDLESIVFNHRNGIAPSRGGSPRPAARVEQTRPPTTMVAHSVPDHVEPPPIEVQMPTRPARSTLQVRQRQAGRGRPELRPVRLARTHTGRGGSSSGPPRRRVQWKWVAGRSCH